MSYTPSATTFSSSLFPYKHQPTIVTLPYKLFSCACHQPTFSVSSHQATYISLGKGVPTGSMVLLERGQSNAQNARIIGSGEVTLVLSHGFGADQSIWDAIVPDLARRCRVVLFDWNFSGAVDYHGSLIDAAAQCCDLYEAFSDDLVALLEEMHLKSVVFVGHSMAGMIGCIAAVGRPELFKRLVLLCASPRYLNTDGYAGGFEVSEVESIFTRMESNFQSWAGTFAGLVVDGRSCPDAVEKFCKSLLRMRPEVALAVAKAAFLSDLRGVLEQVAVPCDVVTGVNDPVVPVPVAHYMQKKIRGGAATLELLDFDGHFPQLTACKTLVDAINKIILEEEEEEEEEDS